MLVRTREPPQRGPIQEELNADSIHETGLVLPTGTSKQVAEAVARGFAPADLEHVDLTRPAVRAEALVARPGELLLIAVPVYMGRVPELLGDWLGRLQTDGTPVACVVVYGNRDYEDALLELATLSKQRGGVPVAGAAFIGEHSFSSPERPTAHGRPDRDDLAQAEDFGRKLREKLDSAASLADIAGPQMPGEQPYRKDNKLWDVDFIEVSEDCVQCGHCADICPTGAIDAEDSATIDEVKCISCCACIKACPQGARSIKPGPVMEASKRLTSLFGEPKQPEVFL